MMMRSKTVSSIRLEWRPCIPPPSARTQPKEQTETFQTKKVSASLTSFDPIAFLYFRCGACLHKYLQHKRSKDCLKTQSNEPEVETADADENLVVTAGAACRRKLWRAGSPLLKLLRNFHDESSRWAFGYVFQGRWIDLVKEPLRDRGWWAGV